MCKYWSTTAAVTMLLGAITAGAQLTTTKRSYTAGKFALELTSPTAAQIYANSITGGHEVSDVVVADLGPDNITKKHLPNVNFTPITVRGNAAELLSTFRAALEQPGVAYDGRILSVDFDYKIHEQLSFARAPVTQILLSALDASSKEAPIVEVTLAPEQVRVSSVANGQVLSYKSQEVKAGSLAFQLQMPGLDDAMSHVTRVESIRMMQTLITKAAGVAEYARSAPGRWENGNIVLTLPLAHAEELSRWRQQLLAGQSAALDKTLDLQLFAGAKELLVLHASGVSLVSMREVKAASADQSLVQAELIVQHWDVVPASSTALR